MKKVMVLGASPNTRRFSHICVRTLLEQGYSVVPIGKRKGRINGEEIVTDKPSVDDLHTVTLYLGAQNQESYYQYILDLQPERIIFNPGAENPHFARMAKEQGIEVVESCTLLMLNSGNF